MNALTPKVRRPALRYHGGKWKLAPWIVAHLPPHRVYVEPFGGAASVLIRKPRSRAEVYNDLDGEVVNLFRVLRDPAAAAELRRLVALTPFARDEFRAAYAKAGSNIEWARMMLVRSFQGFGSAAMTRTHVTGFRKNSNRSGTTPAQDWMNWPEHVPAIVERLRGVIVENETCFVRAKDAFDFARRQFPVIVARQPFPLVLQDKPWRHRPGGGA